MKIGKWLPDYAPWDIGPENLTTAKNVTYYNKKYMPFYDKLVYCSTALNADALRGQLFVDTDGTAYHYIGTPSKLYSLTGTTLSDVSRSSGGAYAAGSNTWNFARYGSIIYATNYVDDVQSITLGGANFAALAGTPPKAKYIIFDNGHLILGYYNDGTQYPKGLKWCAKDTPTTWTASLTTGAGSRILYDASGPMTGIAHVGDIIAVYFEHSIFFMQYTGHPFTYRTYEASYGQEGRSIGAICSGSIVEVESANFFWGKNDIYMLTKAGVKSIGEGVRDTVLSIFDPNYAYRMTHAVDEKKKMIMWSFVSTQSADQNPDYILCYNYEDGFFTLIPNYTHNCIFDGLKGGYTLDGLATAGYTDLDDLPYSLDSSYWKANATTIFMVFPTDDKVYTLTGDPLTAVIETGQKANEGLSVIREVRPIIHKADGTVTVNVGSRRIESSNLSYTASATVDSFHKANTFSTGRYHGFKFTITGSHEGFNNYMVDEVPHGKY